jgi:predicted DsbA family dithiol-disulfide isomerase
VLVEIYSDVVCPWCFIGKRRFEEALAGHPAADDFEVVFRPFQLDPTAPSEPTPVLDAYARKFGGPAEAVRIVHHLTEVAAGSGLTFHLEEALRANTFDAHRLLEHALDTEGPAVQRDVKERLLEAYFINGENIADHPTLVRLAGAAGLDEARVATLLAGDEGGDELRARLQQAYELGVTAVPTFVFDERWSVPGAQEVDVFRRVLDRMSSTPAA